MHKRKKENKKHTLQQRKSTKIIDNYGNIFKKNTH